MASFFIDRPIFAWVIAILIMMAGALSLYTLPVAQYPNIAPPEISVTAIFPGASAKTLEDTVTQVIEQQMKGIDNLNYMYSTSDSTGQAVVTLSFTAGTNVDIAQVQVQNKLQLAMPKLPQEVQRQGVTVAKATKNYLIVIGFVSRDGSMSGSDIGDYIASNVQDPISRVPGVGDINIFGAQYAMRIWCDPAKFEQYKVTPQDVAQAIQAQNAQVAGGQLGGAPSVPGQQETMTVIAATRLERSTDFENILIRTNPDGSSVYLKDVARIELNGESFNSLARYGNTRSGQTESTTASALAIKLATGANALATADAIKARINQLSHFFPAGLEAVYPYDTTPFVRISIHEVYKTLGEAIVLVFLVMYLFLQDFRATLIPTIAVPVVLLGTFGVLAAAGFSINTLTMFGMVLAIGLLVDDAIVVVENVERLMREEHLPPKEAAKKSMSQITGALVGIAMVLSAVFIPMAFFGGSTGVIYRQFSITIVASMALSVLVAMILTPALCATMLKPHVQKTAQGFFGRFNRWFDSVTLGYQAKVHSMVVKPVRWLIIYGGAVALMAFMFLRLPTAFLPDEDQGMMFVMVQLPPGATFERTNDVLKEVEHHFLVEEKEAVDGLMTVAGFSFAGNGQNSGMAFVRLKDWEERNRKDLRVPAIQARAFAKFGQIKEGMVLAFAPPAVMELGNATGFDFELIDQAGLGHDELMKARDTLLASAKVRPELIGSSVRHNGLSDVGQYNLEIDLAKAGALSVPLSEINSTIAAFWGSMYVNDFTDKGRTKKVILQADAPFRMQADDFKRFYVRNTKGDMVPLSAFTTGNTGTGSPRLERYNGLSSVEILGQPAPGRSSGQAMAVMEELASKLPSGFGFSWTGMSYQERMSGNQAPALYAISLTVVFLCLAALYESWSIPFSVLLVVPLGVIGALGGAFLRGLNNDVYFQVGLLTIIGLSAKNAILIVEFAKELEEEGQDLIEATVHAVHLRLRPIIMTSLAFILGVLPLAISTGAGSGSQNAIGTGVMCGMLTATGLGVFYTPIFFVVVSRLFKVKVAHKQAVQGGAHG